MKIYDNLHGNMVIGKLDRDMIFNTTLGLLAVLLYISLFCMIGYTNMVYNVPVWHTFIEVGLISVVAFGGAIKIELDNYK